MHSLVSLDRRVNAGIAVGVDAQLPPSLMRPPDDTSQLFQSIIQGPASIPTQIIGALVRNRSSPWPWLEVLSMLYTSKVDAKIKWRE
jgi:hypothetical protein